MQPSRQTATGCKKPHGKRRRADHQEAGSLTRTEGSEEVSTPNASELLVQLAREAELQKILAMAKECKTLDELIAKISDMLNK
jgi:hypothetical protein